MSSTLKDLPPKLRLCVELLMYAAMDCPQTENNTASEIKDKACGFFDRETVDMASEILCGRWPETTSL